MIRYVIRRLLQAVPTVFGVIVITFILFNVVGGSPAKLTLGKNVSPKSLEDFDEQRGANKPLLLGRWAPTRACADSEFDRHAGPWKSVEGAVHDEAGGCLELPPGTYPLPLAFALREDTPYRWTLRYRLPAGGSARVEWNADGEIHRADLAAAGRLAAARIDFGSGRKPAELAPVIHVEGAGLRLERLTLRRGMAGVFDSQLVYYLRQIARFDFGVSSSTNQRVAQMLKDGILPSLALTVPIFFTGLTVSIALSLVCAFYRDTWVDRWFVVISVMLMSINYLIYIVVGQFVLAYKLPVFPIWGFETWYYLILPGTIGVVSGLGGNLRFYRTVMLDEMYRDYVRTAFAKGVSNRMVLFRHVLKNAMIPIVTNVVIAIPFLYAGSLLLESFFGIPGLGYLGINAINSSDVDVLRALVLIGALLYVVANLLTDICYALVDPRVTLK